MEKTFIKNELFKNGIFILVALLLLMVLIYGVSDKQNNSEYILPLAKADITDNVSGYAWSDNIGWVSFNCTDTDTCSTSDYGVSIGANNKLFGYAWSDNIGWISFNESDLSGCPSGICRAEINDNDLNGWARALAGLDSDDGWDGWISLSTQLSDNIAYGVVLNEETSIFEGYAWGDEVVGWINFNPNYGEVIFTGNFPSIVTFEVSSVVTGNTTHAFATTEYAVSCDLTSTTGYENLNFCNDENQCATIDLPIDIEVWEETTYTLTCLNEVEMSVEETRTPFGYIELSGNPTEVVIDFVGSGATTTPTEIGIISWNGYQDDVLFSTDISTALPESLGDETTNTAIFSRLTLPFSEYFFGITSTLKIFASQRFTGIETFKVFGNDREFTNITINAGNIEPVYEEI